MDRYSERISKIRVIKKNGQEKEIVTPEQKVLLFEQRLRDLRRLVKSLDHQCDQMLTELTTK